MTKAVRKQTEDMVMVSVSPEEAYGGRQAGQKKGRKLTDAH